MQVSKGSSQIMELTCRLLLLDILYFFLAEGNIFQTCYLLDINEQRVPFIQDLL